VPDQFEGRSIARRRIDWLRVAREAAVATRIIVLQGELQAQLRARADRDFRFVRDALLDTLDDGAVGPLARRQMRRQVTKLAPCQIILGTDNYQALRTLLPSSACRQIWRIRSGRSCSASPSVLPSSASRAMPSTTERPPPNLRSSPGRPGQLMATRSLSAVFTFDCRGSMPRSYRWRMARNQKPP
jgi:hypothetical protein